MIDRARRIWRSGSQRSAAVGKPCVVMAAVALMSSVLAVSCRSIDAPPTGASDAAVGMGSFVTDVLLPEGEGRVVLDLLPGRDRYFVKVSVNGRPDVNFLLDTGTDYTVIDQSTADIWRLPEMDRVNTQIIGMSDEITREARLLRVDSLTIGPVRVITRRMREQDLKPWSREYGFAIRGIVGMDILGRLPVTLDLQECTLTFHDPAAFIEPADAEPFEPTFGRESMRVAGRVGNAVEAEMLIDTGFDDPVLLRRDFVDRHPGILSGSMVPHVTTEGLSGARFDVESGRAAIDVLGQSFEDIPVSVSVGFPGHEWDGILGTRLLRDFRLTFDAPGRRMWAAYQPQKPIAQRLEEGLEPDEIDLCGRSHLFPLIERGEVEGAQALIEAGADVNLMSNVGMTPLSVAASWGRLRIAEILLDAGAEVNMPVGRQLAPLALASGADRESLVELLLARGAAVDATHGNHRDTALHAAGGNAAITRMLLAAGADANAASDLGLTPLHVAAGAGAGEAVELLLARGADVNARIQGGFTFPAADRDDTGERRSAARFAVDRFIPTNCTPAMLAAQMGRLDAVQRLLAAGADLEARTDNGQTILMIAAIGGHEELARWLLEAGADPCVLDDEDMSVLAFAAARLTPETVRLLIERGADVSAASRDGQTPLMMAALLNHREDVIVELIRAGADVHRESANGSSALAGAARAGNAAAIRQLLDAGADVNSANDKGVTPLMKAVLWRYASCAEVVELLLRAGADVDARTDRGDTALIVAAERGSADVLARLIDAGADVNASCTRGVTPLMQAAGSRSADAVRLLLKHGADVNAADEHGRTPLYKAAGSGVPEIVRLLLAAGADIHAAGNAGGALHAAADRCRLDCARILLDAGADVNVVDENGCTPLMRAVISRDDQIVAALIDVGADVNAAAGDGTTPLRVANKLRDELVVTMLKEAGSRLR